MSSCPYCGEEVGDGRAPRFCTHCGTPHHEDCWEDNGGCTVFGCASAPPDEIKVSVGVTELAQTAAPPPPPMGFAVPPPPFPSPLSPPPPRAPAAAAPPAPMAFTFGGYNTVRPSALALPVFVRSPKDRAGFIILGVFLGAFGAHNFYAGYVGRAVAQLLLTLLSFFLLSPITYIWAVVEICTIDRDAHGVHMK